MRFCKFWKTKYHIFFRHVLSHTSLVRHVIVYLSFMCSSLQNAQLWKRLFVEAELELQQWWKCSIHDKWLPETFIFNFSLFRIHHHHHSTEDPNKHLRKYHERSHIHHGNHPASTTTNTIQPLPQQSSKNVSSTKAASPTPQVWPLTQTFFVCFFQTLFGHESKYTPHWELLFSFVSFSNSVFPALDPWGAF